MILRFGGSTDQVEIKMSALATKTFLSKAWVWLKHYWYWPVILILLILSGVFARKQYKKLIAMFEISKQSYERQIKEINQNHEKELKKREELYVKYIETLKKIELEEVEAFNSLTTEKKKELAKFAKEYKGKPEDLAKDLSKMFGVEYVE